MPQVVAILAGFIAGIIVMLLAMHFALRRAEQRARLAERRARDAERLAELGSMTSGLAHEIRNPLSTITLNAQLLAEAIAEIEAPREERDRLLRRIEALRREAERLRGILEDFLQFAGRIKLDRQPHDLAALVDELADFFLPQCARAGVTLRTNLPDTPAVAEVDVKLLKQAVLNLMINGVQAMEHAPNQNGGTARELILRLETLDHQAHLHVIDTGPGVDSERLETIFRPYVSHKAGGTGLGLPIARRIIEEHGGTIEVVTEQGRGSDFTIHLPLQT